MPQDDNTSKFVAAITKEAEARQAQIEQQTDAYIKAELDKAEDSALRESYDMIQHKIMSIREELGRELSKREMESRKNLFVRRDEITNEVFAALKDRLNAFVSSPDYAAFLSASLSRAAANFQQGEELTVFLRPADMSHRSALEAAAGKTLRFEEDPSIAIGGLKVQDLGRTLLCDDTLDMRLQGEHCWFAEHSGLRIASD